MAYYSRKFRMPFQAVVEKITENLAHHGFGVITTIDVRDTFKRKLNVGFRNYKILGACDPTLAYKAITLESHIGVMLPCNIVVQEHENGETEVTAINPLEKLDKAFYTTQLADLATEIGIRLRATVDYIHREEPKIHHDALPV